MKAKDELNALKSEVEALNAKLAELTEDELKEVTGGFVPKTEPVMSPSGESSPFDCNGYFFKLD